MRKKTIIISQVLVASALLTAYFVNGCEGSPIECQVGRGEFVGKFYQISQVSNPPTACDNLKGDAFGFYTYYDPTSEGLPDYSKPRLAIQPATLGQAEIDFEGHGLEDTNTTHSVYSIGYFDDSTPTNNVCTASEMSIAEMEYPEVPSPMDPKKPLHPAFHIRYTWTDINVLVTASAIGTQVVAHLTYQDFNADCTATYEVQFVMPYIGCAGEGTDDKGKSLPDERYCSAYPIDGFSISGSGLNPDFDIECNPDPDFMVCVPKTLESDLQDYSVL